MKVTPPRGEEFELARDLCVSCGLLTGVTPRHHLNSLTSVFDEVSKERIFLIGCEAVAGWVSNDCNPVSLCDPRNGISKSSPFVLDITWFVVCEVLSKYL